MSELRVDSVKSKGGGAPDLPKGVTISGIATAATLGATTVDVSNVNVSGVVTSGTLSGSLLSTGTPTLGLGVTINSSGLVVSGVATAGIVSATTLYGDGTNLTGVGASIAPLFYNPDVGDMTVPTDTGIGITFNQQIKAGTGNITIRETNASGTVVENFGVGSSVTISENKVSFTPTSDLSNGQLYHLSYPSGCFTNNEGSDYVGTAYTFQALGYNYNLYSWGSNEFGNAAQNNLVDHSSPVQIPGTNWAYGSVSSDAFMLATKTDGTLWAWGNNDEGQLAQNDAGTTDRSSPVQIPGTTWDVSDYDKISGDFYSCGAIKTDGTLWTWGRGFDGALGVNDRADRSSPVQVPGTTWKYVSAGNYRSAATKTDGTAWLMGSGASGSLGLNTHPTIDYSSPVQLPGTTWDIVRCSAAESYSMGRKTDGTLWVWGYNANGRFGIPSIARNASRSSPCQIPGTTWSSDFSLRSHSVGAIKTDGTLWGWGQNNGALGQNSRTFYSSPVQIPGTTWKDIEATGYYMSAVKTDGTLWSWGYGYNGMLGQNQPESTFYSSPVQIGTDTDWDRHLGCAPAVYALKKTEY